MSYDDPLNHRQNDRELRAVINEKLAMMRERFGEPTGEEGLRRREYHAATEAVRQANAGIAELLEQRGKLNSQIGQLVEERNEAQRLVDVIGDAVRVKF